MSSSVQSVNIRLSCLHACTFGAVGIMLPFWPAWLESRIPDPDLIGLLLGVMMLIRVVLDPLIAQAIDKRGERKRPVLIAQALTALCYVMFLFSDQIGWLVGMSILAGAAYAPIIPLSNVLTLDAAVRHGLDYGRMRLWGSIAFILISMGGGYLLDRAGIDAVVWIIAGLMGLGMVAAWNLPDHRVEKPHKDGSVALVLLREPVFLIFLAAVALVQSSHGFYYGFATLHWRSVGYSDAVIGGFWSVGVLAEILLFVFAKRLNVADKPALLMVIGGLGGIVRWSILAFTDNPAVIIAAQTLHAATFGCTHLGAMYFMARAIPPKFAATAQSLNGAMVMGGAIGITIWISGPLYAQFGALGFAVMSIFAAGGALICLLLSRAWTGAKLIEDQE